MRPAIRATAFLGAVFALLVLCPGPAVAASYPNGYAYWTYPDRPATVYSVREKVRVVQPADMTFWALVWVWDDESVDGGYVGLQTDGSRWDGSSGDLMIYSVWNATRARSPAGGSCRPFEGEGEGMSCRVNTTLRPGHWYRYTVTRGRADGAGQWWKAKITDQTAHKTYPLGSIQARDTATSMSPWANFTEYFGGEPDCARYPKSVVDWQAPTLNGDATDVARFDGTGYQDCTPGRIQERSYHGHPGVRLSRGV